MDHQHDSHCATLTMPIQARTPQKAPASQKRLRGVFVVSNPKGLHTRPSTELVRCASQYRAEIFLKYQRVAVNAKSLLGILTLAAGKGSHITVEAEGEDAHEAIAAILSLAENRFFMSF